jgi:hypothetical protein
MLKVKFSFALRMFYFFKAYIVPNKRERPQTAKMLKKSYQYLILEKTAHFSHPLFFKYGLNCLAAGSGLWYCSLVFTLYGLTEVTRTYFNGRRIVANSGIVKLAIMETSQKVFKALLNTDYNELTSGTR